MAFYDPVESTFYGWCVERLLSCDDLGDRLDGGLLEIGTGTAVPVADALLRSRSSAHVTGYELDPASVAAARSEIQRLELPNYTVVQGDFFECAVGAPQRCVIGNPPYLPAMAGPISAPLLWGGQDGADVTRGVLARGFDTVMLVIASISNPEGVIDFAREQGYTVLDWMSTPIRFGRYCRDIRVRSRISDLARSGHAFFGPDSYLIAGVTWVRQAAAADQADVLARVMRGAGNASRITAWPGRAGDWRRTRHARTGQPAAAAPKGR